METQDRCKAYNIQSLGDKKRVRFRQIGNENESN